MSVQIEKPVASKKEKETVKKKSEKDTSWKVRAHELFEDENEKLLWLTPLQASASGVALSFVFLGGVGILVRKKKLVI